MSNISKSLRLILGTVFGVFTSDASFAVNKLLLTTIYIIARGDPPLVPGRCCNFGTIEMRPLVGSWSVGN